MPRHAYMKLDPKSMGMKIDISGKEENKKDGDLKGDKAGVVSREVSGVKGVLDKIKEK